MDHLHPIPASVFGAAYTSTDGSSDISLEGDAFAGTPRLVGADVGTKSDCLVADVGGSKLVLGGGGYHAPRS